MSDKLHATDVLNFGYLTEIARYIEGPRNWAEAVRMFAYSITNAQEIEHQDRMLDDLLANSTHLQSAASNEKVLASLARSTGSDLQALRRYARQTGVRLKREY